MSELSIFNTWLVEFLDKEGIDVTWECEAGDGTKLDIGDVVVAIVKASEWERQKIRKQMYQCKAKHVPIRQLLETYAKALSKRNKKEVPSGSQI